MDWENRSKKPIKTKKQLKIKFKSSQGNKKAQSKFYSNTVFSIYVKIGLRKFLDAKPLDFGHAETGSRAKKQVVLRQEFFSVQF